MTPTESATGAPPSGKPASTPASEAREVATARTHPLSEEERDELARDLEDLSRRRQFVL
jgi:uncharacterized membrane protein YgcG